MTPDVGLREAPHVEAPVAAHSRLAGAKLRAARAGFADALGPGELFAPALGSIVLRVDQRLAAERVRARLARDGGCLLADDPGTGKTYVALAVARAWRRPLVVVPASLRSTWDDAMRRAAVTCSIISHETLSRGVAPEPGWDGVIVDESHRFRPTSRRHAALARLAAHVPLLMLSATPLQNRPRELAAQLALFLGESAYGMTEAAMARYVVRTPPASDAGLPRVAPPRWLRVAADDGEVLRAILALPPPPRAIDVGDGGALLALSLVRAWSSSRAALLATLRRRRRTLVAMEQCGQEGRSPTRRELRSWTGGDGVQLGFASLLVETSLEADAMRRMADAVAVERTALDALDALLARIEDPDVERARSVVSLRDAHPGVSVLAFSEFAGTVGAYYRAMRAEPGVGMLTAREGRIASGRIARRELLARFSPRAQGVRAPAEHDRVTLLLATDLLSEGMNLQDASVVVHLDLPWNPARLAQRLGRVRRPGGAAEVFGYLMAPPAESALLLRAESRLRAKLARAERTIGRGLEVMPMLAAAGAPHPLAPIASTDSPTSDHGSEAERHGAIVDLVASWRRPSVIGAGSTHRAGRGRCIVAAVHSERRGWAAVLDDGRIVVSLGGPAGEPAAATGVGAEVGAIGSDRCTTWPDGDPRPIELALRLALGEPRPISESRLQAARSEVEAHLARDWVFRSCGVSAPSPALRRAIRRRLDSALLSVARHTRARALAMAGRLRTLLDAPMPLGTERALHAHASPPNGTNPRRVSDDDSQASEEWIREALAMLDGTRDRSRAGGERRGQPRAIIVMGPD